MQVTFFFCITRFLLDFLTAVSDVDAVEVPFVRFLSFFYFIFFPKPTHLRDNFCITHTNTQRSFPENTYFCLCSEDSGSTAILKC